MHWLYLIIAILAEVLATSFLKATEGFTRLGPSCVVVTGYIIAFYFLSLSLRIFPVGIAYALWSSIGTVLIALFAWLFYRQTLDTASIIGIAFIVIGVIIINLFSKSISH